MMLENNTPVTEYMSTAHRLRTLKAASTFDSDTTPDIKTKTQRFN